MWFGGCWVPDFIDRLVGACVGMKICYFEKGVRSSGFIDSQVFLMVLVCHGNLQICSICFKIRSYLLSYCFHEFSQNTCRLGPHNI